MVVAAWSVKGGVGVSSVAAMLAIGQAQRAQETLLVDVCGDVPALLGMAESNDVPGVGDWCAVASPTADALARLQVEAMPFLHVFASWAGKRCPTMLRCC